MKTPHAFYLSNGPGTDVPEAGCVQIIARPQANRETVKQFLYTAADLLNFAPFEAEGPF
tara:strand:- start:116 stop:292 length:177 start_codon:yes stop_codon:yes gene_type:complete